MTLVLPPRLPEWRSRLYRWLDTAAMRPHVYGQHDCALIAAGAIEAMHGVDPAGQFRGRYSTWTGGVRVLRREGFDDLAALLHELGRPVPPMLAQIGDIAMLGDADHPTLGVVTGAQIAAPRPEGMATVPLIAAGPVPRCNAFAMVRT